MANLVNTKYNKQHLLTNSLLSGLQLLGFDIKTNAEVTKTKFDCNLFSKPNSKDSCSAQKSLRNGAVDKATC